MGDRLRSQAVVVTQRVDHARLVQRRQRPARGVGFEQRPLGGARLAGLLDHDGDRSSAFVDPALQPLEAVDQLVDAVGRLEDAQRKLGLDVAGARRPQAAAAQRGKRGPDLAGRQPLEARQAGRGVTEADRLRAPLGGRGRHW
ncbi:MAG: hypothetical protein CMF76_10170 [Maricaulis sp.]|nr:hypothetical protein [Maricaulis sp.]